MSNINSAEEEVTLVKPVTIKTCGTIFLLILFLLLIIDLFSTHILLTFFTPVITSVTSYIEGNPGFGVLLFIFVYAIASLFFFAGVILTLSISYILASSTTSTNVGILLSFISVFFGASLGALLAFLSSRYFLKECVTKKIKNKYWISLDNAIKKKGLRIIFLLRLSPLIPFSALSYLAGTTSIPLKDYMLTMFGMIPGVLLYTYIGATASDISSAEGNSSSSTKTVKTIFMVLGGVFGILGVAICTFYAKREIIELSETSEVGDNSDINTIGIDGLEADNDEVKGTINKL